MFNKILREHREEWPQRTSLRRGGHLSWTLGMRQNSSGPVDGKAIRKISRGQGLWNFRVEEALMGIHDPRSLHLLFCNWNTKLFLHCFFFVVLWFQLDESLTPGTASEKASSLLPHSLACGCPCPLPCLSLNSSLCCAFVPFIEQGPVFRAFERCCFSSYWSPSALISVCDQEQRLLLVLSCFSMCFLASQHALSFLGFGQCLGVLIASQFSANCLVSEVVLC